MAFSGDFDTDPRRLEEHTDDNGESDDEFDSDDSESDPSYSLKEEKTNSKVSRSSIRKKSKPLEVVDIELIEEIDVDDAALNVPIVNENDEKDIHEVLSIIKAGKLEKLKVEQCKVYLRKNGLRLTGTKDVLIQRINEHLEIINGGGERKYPEYSFIVNCKGDACMGDVVMFEQKVYEMYNVASRSAIGPSCGTRTVAGRIVKESYGASKQQHTFTIEVLWSKGEKPHPPLHPLLIKGRNLYRMKTMRQTWADEGERQKVLREKHARGSLARSNRGVRVAEKEKRKVPKENRKSRKEGFSDNPSQPNLSSAGTMLAESMVNLSVDPRKANIHQHQHQHQQVPLCGNPGKPLQQQQSENQTTMQTKSEMLIDHRRLPFQLQHNYLSQPQMKADRPASYNIHPSIYRADHDHAASIIDARKCEKNYNIHPSIYRADRDHAASVIDARKFEKSYRTNHTSVNDARKCEKIYDIHPSIHRADRDHAAAVIDARKCEKNYRSKQSSSDYYCRLPMEKMNLYPRVNHEAADERYKQKQQRCRYYGEGRCYYGENCKYSHEMTEEFDRRDRERWDDHHHRSRQHVHQNAARLCR